MPQVFMAGAGNTLDMYTLDGTALLSEPRIRDLASDRPENPEKDVVLSPVIDRQGRTTGWILQYRQGRRGVWVNGLERTQGFYRVGDGDRIRVVGGCSIVFTGEVRPSARPFPGAKQPVKCSRCHTVLEKGAPAVCCADCGAWAHHDPGEAKDCCWRCEDTCAFCGAPTAMDRQLRRIPEVN